MVILQLIHDAKSIKNARNTNAYATSGDDNVQTSGLLTIIPIFSKTVGITYVLSHYWASWWIGPNTGTFQSVFHCKTIVSNLQWLWTDLRHWDIWNKINANEVKILRAHRAVSRMKIHSFTFIASCIIVISGFRSVGIVSLATIKYENNFILFKKQVSKRVFSVCKLHHSWMTFLSFQHTLYIPL